MGYFKSIILILPFLFLTSSFAMSEKAKNGEVIIMSLNTVEKPYDRDISPFSPMDRGNIYDEIRRKTVFDRASVLSCPSSRRYVGRVCEDEKDENHECKDQCRDIYSQIKARNNCEELMVAYIVQLEKLDELLESPNRDDLECGVDHDVFDIYIIISTTPLNRHIDRYSRREAKEFLLWMIDNPDIAKAFEREDIDYKILNTLLQQIGSFSGNDHHVSFLEKMDGSDKLMEVVIDSGNEEVMEWFQEYIHQHNSDCNRDETSLACFSVYCKIGKGIDKDSAGDWLSFETFEDYISDIIDEETNGTAWSPSSKQPGGADSYKDHRDLDEDWVDALCSGLT